MKIIANIIALDSEPELPALLASLAGKVDGVVAVDGGSSDRTVELFTEWGLATKTPVAVFVNPWPDDFALQRNICLEKTRAMYGVSTKDKPVWVLMIDTDDTLEQFDRAYLETAIETQSITGIACRMDNGNGFFHCAQFFELSPSAFWKNPIHEFIKLDGEKALPAEGTLTIKRGCAKRHAKDPMRNVRIGRRAVERDPEDSRIRFYLGRDLIECDAIPPRQRKAEAEGHLRVYMTLGGRFIEQDRYALLLLVGLLRETGRIEEARRMLLDWIEDDPNNRSAYEALSRLTAGAASGVWNRLAASAEGGCVLPYACKLPKKV